MLPGIDKAMQRSGYLFCLFACLGFLGVFLFSCFGLVLVLFFCLFGGVGVLGWFFCCLFGFGLVYFFLKHWSSVTCIYLVLDNPFFYRATYHA